MLLFVVKESVTGRELYRRECRFFEFIEINPADLNFTEVSFYSYADVTIYYPGEDGISFDYNVDLHLIPHSGYVKPTEEKAPIQGEATKTEEDVVKPDELEKEVVVPVKYVTRNTYRYVYTPAKFKKK